MGEDEYSFAPDEVDETAPKIPTFFQPSDLPDWLREPLSIAPPPTRHESVRARQAWATAERTHAPEETGEFQTVGKTTLTRLVPTPPTRNARKRRGLFGIGAALPTLPILPIVAFVV